MINTKYLELYNEFIQNVKKYISKQESLDRIDIAFELAEKCHDGQLRKNGDPYIVHPVEVANILTRLNAGPDTIIAALLHDTVEDTDLTLDEIEELLGKEIRDMVDGVTKISKVEFKTSKTQIQYQQKMLIAMANDIRVVIIKIADRLHNIRTLKFHRPERQTAIAKETLEIYAPLAHRLGMFKIKAELEDTCLKYADNEMFLQVKGLIQQKKEEREKSIEKVINDITLILNENNIKDFEIKGRIKNIFSIYKKLVFQKKDFEDIYDLLAVRIIVSSISECYHVLGLIHSKFTPIPKRFKDYIAMPKPNLYQSLHTTVLYNDGTIFEVQIRTKEMDDIAELGIAAHWAYKESRVYSKDKEQFEMASKLKWYSDLLKISKDEDENTKEAEEFVDTIKQDILQANVYVFTPNGEVIELPKGATSIDFAYSIHTEVGNKMVGATINNKIAPIDTILKTGDIVSIKTSKTQTPSEDWLKVVKSSHARTKIKAYLNKINRDKLLEKGREDLLLELEKNKIDEIPDDNFIEKNFEKQNIKDLEELLIEIGKGIISPKTVIAKILGNEEKKDPETILQRQMEKATKTLTTVSDTGIYVEGLSKPQVKLAQCCFPVLNDEVVGYVTKNQGIVVHLKSCINISQFDVNRKIEVFWASDIKRKYATWILITAEQKNSLMADIITTINSSSISIVQMHNLYQDNLKARYKVKVLLKDLKELELLLLNIKKIPSIFKVERIIK